MLDHVSERGLQFALTAVQLRDASSPTTLDFRQVFVIRSDGTRGSLPERIGFRLGHRCVGLAASGLGLLVPQILHLRSELRFALGLHEAGHAEFVLDVGNLGVKLGLSTVKFTLLLIQAVAQFQRLTLELLGEVRPGEPRHGFHFFDRGRRLTGQVHSGRVMRRVDTS